MLYFLSFLFLCFYTTAPADNYTLSLHDALPISVAASSWPTLSTSCRPPNWTNREMVTTSLVTRDRKSTRLNSSHVAISYAVFCLKKKKKYRNSKKIQLTKSFFYLIK